MPALELTDEEVFGQPEELTDADVFGERELSDEEVFGAPQAPGGFQPIAPFPFKVSSEVQIKREPGLELPAQPPDPYTGHKEKFLKLLNASNLFSRGVGSREALEEAHREFQIQKAKERQAGVDKEVEAAAENMAPYKGSHALWTLLNTPTIQAKPPEEYVREVEQSGTKTEKRLLGIREALDDFLSSMTSPLSVGTIGAAGVLQGAPALARGLSALFGIHMGQELAGPIAEEMGRELAKPANERDERKVANLWTAAITTAPFTATLGAHALGPKARTPEILPEPSRPTAKPNAEQRATVPPEIPVRDQRPVAPAPEQKPLATLADVVGDKLAELEARLKAIEPPKTEVPAEQVSKAEITPKQKLPKDFEKLAEAGLAPQLDTQGVTIKTEKPISEFQQIMNDESAPLDLRKAARNAERGVATEAEKQIVRDWADSFYTNRKLTFGVEEQPKPFEDLIPKKAERPVEPLAPKEIPATPASDVLQQSVQSEVSGQPTVTEPGKSVKVAKGLRARKIFQNETEFAGPDILSWIEDNMKLLSKSQAKKQYGTEKWNQNKSGWDDTPPLSKPHHNVIYDKNGFPPDRVAQAAYEAGFLKEPSVNALWEEIGGSSSRRSKVYENQRREAQLLKREETELKAWQKATAQGEMRVQADELKVGDVMEVEGERVRVKEIDADTGDLILDDGKKFGVQKLPSGESIHVEKFEPAEIEGADWTVPEPEKPLPKLRSMEKQGDLMATQAEDFALAGERGMDAERIQREKAQSEIRAEEARAIQEKQQEKLFGAAQEAPTLTPEASRASDISRHKAIWEEIKKIDMEDPKFMELWAEAEKIKNKYGGYVPTESKASAEAIQGGAAKGPPLTPLPPSGVTPKAKSQMIRDLSEAVGTPIRFGRLITRKFGGYFKSRANLIGSKRANDIPTVAHEVGHRLNQMFKLTTDRSLQSELLDLGDNARPGSMSSWTPSKPMAYRMEEGLAEFVRYWMIDPHLVSTMAPKLDAAFKNALASNKSLEASLHQTREDIRNWRIAEPQARLMSNVSVGNNPNKTRYTLSDLTRDVMDDLHYLKLATEDAKLLSGAGLEPSKNPYVLARLMRGVYGVADTFVNQGPVDFTTRKVSMGNGLKQILEPVGSRLSDFRAYIIARQALEMRKQGKATGLEDADVDFVFDKYKNDAQFNQAFDKLKKWSDSFIQYSVDAGYISPDSAAAMRKMNQEYVPMHRIFEVGAGEFGQPTGGSGRGLNAVGQSFKGRKGSQRDIVDPLETYIKNAYTIIQNAEKNAVNIAVADLANKPGMGRLVERIATPKQAEKVSLAKLREELEKAGADLTGVPDDLLLTFWKDSNFAPRGENIIRVNRGGKAEFYRLSPELYKTMAALDHESAGVLAKILSAPAQVLRAGVTLTPDFALSNAARDTLASAVVSRHGVFPFQHTLRGLYALVRDPKTVAEWKASGASQSVEAHYFDRESVQKFIQSQIGKDFSYKDYGAFIAKSPLTAMRILSGALEQGTRIGEYQQVYGRLRKKGYSEGEARRLAAFESRDLQDFAMGGAKTKALRRATAFWNAAMQGNYRLYQNLKDPATRWQTMTKGFAWVTVPSITLFLLNKDDADYWDRPQWERDLFWLIPRGKDEFGHTQFLRIPKPFEIGLIFGTVPERIMAAWLKEDPKAFDGLAEQAMNASIPNPVPQALMTAAEVSAGPEGYSWFRHRPIVPKSLEGMPPELQFTEQNSVTAKRIGKAIGVSPMKIDHAVGGLTGTLGRQTTHHGVDRVLSWMTGEPRTARETYPGARFIATPAGTQSQAIENFYEELDKLRREKKADRITPQDEDRLKELESTARELSELRKEQKKATTDRERQEIGLKMRELVKSINN